MSSGDDDYRSYDSSTYQPNFDNPLYLDLHGPGEYYSSQYNIGNVYYSGDAYENYGYYKSYHTTYENTASGYYHTISVYEGISYESIFSITEYNGSSNYYLKQADSFSGNPFRGYTSSYDHYEAANGSSNVSYRFEYQTAGVSLPAYTYTAYTSVYTNAYGYAYETSGSSHT